MIHECGIGTALIAVRRRAAIGGRGKGGLRGRQRQMPAIRLAGGGGFLDAVRLLQLQKTPKNAAIATQAVMLAAIASMLSAFRRSQLISILRWACLAMAVQGCQSG